MTDSLTIIVRSAAERTETLCHDSLRAQTEAPIQVIRERPFLTALHTSMRLGIEGGKEFTLCVDADVLLAPGAVQRMLDAMRAAPDAFYATGYSLDKFYGQPKARSAHLYRTRFLEEADQALPAAGPVARPESAMKQVLVERGRQFITVEGRLLGTHGYGQYYRDIFRTIANRGQKSPDEFALLMDRFSRKAGRDLDLRVALWGLVASREGDLSLDAQTWTAHVEDLLRTSEIPEKQDVSKGEAVKLVRLARLAGMYHLAWWRRYRRIRGGARPSAP